MALGQNQTQATFVGGESPHHCATPHRVQVSHICICILIVLFGAKFQMSVLRKSQENLKFKYTRR